MYTRLIIAQLRAWKKKTNRKPLILRGARQVGKTTLVKDFGKEFDHFIYLNLEITNDAEIFKKYDSVNGIINYLFLRNHLRKSDCGDTLLFIDEIQEEEKAVTMLRYFFEEASWLYVIAAGSRLQTLVRKHASFPVGRVEYMTLRPFCFVEFLNAADGEEWVQQLQGMKVDAMMHNALNRRFSQYALIGSMPEAVTMYLDTHDVEAVSSVYRSLQTIYAEDVERYARGNVQMAVMRHILQYGWTKAGQSITYTHFAGSSYTATQVHEAMDILQRAFILSLNYRLHLLRFQLCRRLCDRPN